MKNGKQNCNKHTRKHTPSTRNCNKHMGKHRNTLKNIKFWSKMVPGVPRGRGLGTYLGALGKRPRFWLDFGAFWAPRGAPWETLVGAIFVPGPLPRRSQGARGAIFRPSLVSPALDPQFDPQKLPKSAFFKGAQTLKIELAPARECDFHIFASFLSEP